MKKIIIVLTLISTYQFVHSQVIPNIEIEGRLDISLPSDTTSIHIGKNAGINQETSSRKYNTFVGLSAGLMNKQGSNNNFFGYKAGVGNTTGSKNCYFGNFAASYNKIGSNSVAIGHLAAMGYNGSGIDTSLNNTVAIGYAAGAHGGDSSVFIGYAAGVTNFGGTLDNRLYINNSSGNNPLIYGEFDTKLIRINGDFHAAGKILLENEEGIVFKKADGMTEKEILSVGINDHTQLNAANDIIFNSGNSTIVGFRAMTIKANKNVGIGTTIPHWKTVIEEKKNAITGAGTHVDISELALVIAKEENENNEAVGIGFQSSSGEENIGAAIIHERTGINSKGSLHFATKSSEDEYNDIPISMTITDQGKVGIGILNPTALLDVAGDVNGIGLFCNYVSTCSDVRYKKEFSTILSPLSIVNKLTGYFHYWNTEKYPEKKFLPKRQLGFKAQEVQQILPEIVNATAHGYLSVEYGKVVPLLIEAIKEQQSIIEDLENKLKNQDLQFNSLFLRVKKLEKTK